MRINRYVALASGMSRRAADRAIGDGRVSVNGMKAEVALDVSESDTVKLDGKPLTSPKRLRTIMLNKPVGFVVSRDGQGSRTIYDLIPRDLSRLKPIGRLDKDSSGLILLTEDGVLAHSLSHPRFEKTKEYEVRLDKDLQPLHRQMISDIGIHLDDGPSRFMVERIRDGDERNWKIIMHEGRNRQIRRTFTVLGYAVIGLHRTRFGTYVLSADLGSGAYAIV